MFGLAGMAAEASASACMLESPPGREADFVKLGDEEARGEARPGPAQGARLFDSCDPPLGMHLAECDLDRRAMNLNAISPSSTTCAWKASWVCSMSMVQGVSIGAREKRWKLMTPAPMSAGT